MNYELFDKGASYLLPTGKTILAETLMADPQYKALADKPCVITIDNGVFTSYSTLENFASAYHVSYDADNLQNTLELALKNKEQMESESIEFFNDRASANSLITMAKYAALSVPDEIALEVPDLYPVWAPNTEYEQDERITYNSQLYKVAQKHTSQDTDGWRPGESGSAALYSAVTIGSSGHDQWKMPTGAHDAYNMDDIVEYNGKLYQSKMDGNTTIPGQSRFWVEYTE